MDLTVLGCGGSAGVPLIGCHCQVCRSSNPKNKRLRSSLLLINDQGSLLIDIGPDFRTQALQHGIETKGNKSILALMLTHLHYDHVAGLDELRIFNFKQKRAMPCILSTTHVEELKQRYSYIFTPSAEKRNKTPSLELMGVDPQSSINYCGFHMKFFRYWQGGMEVMGFRTRDFAYIPDIKDYEASLLNELEGVQRVIIAAHSYRESPVHFHVDEAVEFIKKMGVKKAYLTHMGHEIDYEDGKERLPEYIEPAYDGLRLFEV